MEFLTHSYCGTVVVAGERITVSGKAKPPVTQAVVEEMVAEMRIPISTLEPIVFHLFDRGFGPLGKHIMQGDTAHVLLSPLEGKLACSTPIHELGHAFWHRFILGTEYYSAYADIRGHSRISEWAAEDYRLIFGGPKARDAERHKESGKKPEEDRALPEVEDLFLRAMLAKMERIKPLQLCLWIGQPYYILNGKRVMMSAAPFIKDDRTFVPIRFVAEALGYAVDWDDKAKKVTISRGGDEGAA